MRSGLAERGRWRWNAVASTRVAGLLVALVGALIVLGWAVGAVIIPSANAASPAIRLNTGVCLLLVGAGLALAAWRRAALGRALGAVVVVIGLLTLFEYVAHTSLGIDQLAFDDHSRSVGRMAPNTAVGLILLGAALVTAGVRRMPWQPAELLALAGGMIGWLGVIGYAADLPALLHVGGFLRIALPTAICFVVAGVAVTVGPARGRLAGLVASDGPAGPLVRRLFTAVVLVPPLVALPLRAVHSQGTTVLVLIAVLAVVFLSIVVSFAVSLAAAAPEAQERAELLDLAHDAVIVRDPVTSRISYWNREAEELYGYAAEDARGCVTHDLLATRFPEPLESIYAALLERGRWEGELDHRRADGARLLVSSRQALKRGLDGEPASIIELNSDITERKRAERALARSNVELEQFASVTSHDLQEPLRTINGFADLLVRRHEAALDDEGRRYLDFIMSGTVRMQALIDGMLSYARVGRGGQSAELHDSGALVAAALGALDGTVVATGAQIEVGELPPVVANGAALTQVFQNLIANALKFSDAATPVVAITAERDGDAWRFAVADNGIGIDPAQADRVFRMFQRLHADGHYDGTGIGLAICKRIVEGHGGRIWCEPRAEGGTVFQFTLPDGGAEE
jgi:PAS domain S-box-containing protein